MYYQMFAYSPAYCALELCIHGSKSKPTAAEIKVAAENGYNIVEKRYYPNVETALDVVRGHVPCNWQELELRSCPILDSAKFKGKDEEDIISQTWDSPAYHSERCVTYAIKARPVSAVGL